MRTSSLAGGWTDPGQVPGRSEPGGWERADGADHQPKRAFGPVFRPQPRGMTPYLHTSVDGAVATLLIDRPAKRNAISLEMWGSLPALVDDVCSDPEIRVLIITGAHPGVFSAGPDIGEFPGLRSEVPAGRHYSATIRAGQRAVAGARVPTIAAISGL